MRVFSNINKFIFLLVRLYVVSPAVNVRVVTLSVV